MTSHSKKRRSRKCERIVEGELVEPYTTCKKHGAIYDFAHVIIERDRRRGDDYIYYRCRTCRRIQGRAKDAVSRPDRKRIKEAIFARVQDMTGHNPVVTKVQKRVVDMFLSINNRSTKK